MRQASPSRWPKKGREAALMAMSAALPILARAYRAAADHAVAHVGLSQAMAWPVVMIGRHGEGPRQGVLAELLGIEGPSLVRPLDQLVEGGFVERRDDPADRRAKTLHLTEAGVAAHAQIEASLRTLRADICEGVSDDDLAACLRVFGALQKKLGCPQPVVPPMRDEY